MKQKKQLLSLLRPVRRRLNHIQLIRAVLIGFFVGLLVGCVWLFIGRFYPIVSVRLQGVTLISLGIVGGLIYKLFKPVTPLQAAQVMDRSGLEDAMSTALLFITKDSAVIRLQRDDAVLRAQAFLPRLKEVVSIPRWRMRWSGTGLLLALFIALCVWQNPMDDIVAEKIADAQWIEEQTEQVTTMLQALTHDDKQSKMEESLIEMLAQLQADLEETKLATEALAAFEEKLIALEKLLDAQEAQRAELGVNKEEGASDLAEMDESKQLAEHIQEQLAQMGSPMADRLMDRGIAVSDSWAPGGLANAIADFGAMGEGSGSGSGSSSGEGEGSGSGSGSGSDEGEGSGSGSGSGSGEGSGSGSGSGSGEGEGLGSGSGSGSGEGEGEGSGSGSGSGAGISDGGRNLVFTPRTLTGEGEHHVDPGAIDGSGGDIFYDGQSPILDGVSRPYEEVYAQYANEAKDTLNRSPLPHHMQELVRDYFIEIQPDR